MPDLGDPDALRAKFCTDDPNRRVEREELAEWLEEVGDAEFMDDLHAVAAVEKLWGESRYRNAHLIANVTAERLSLCGWADAEVRTILKYLQPEPVPQNAGPPSVITAVIQPDPDADRRSKEQSDALLKALSDAVAGKQSIERFIDGESRRPTVTEARAYVDKAGGTAGKLHTDLADALSALHSDPHADVTAQLLGHAVIDKELYGIVRKSLTPPQYKRFGQNITDSGVLLLKAVLQYSVQLEQKLYNAKYAECEKVGKTHNAVSMVKRLQLLEDSLAQVRYCSKFDLCEAMDMVYNAVAPVPSIMMEAMVAWQASVKTQDDLDTVLIQVKEKAESYALGASNSTQNTPQPNNKVKQHHNHSGSSRGYHNKSNTRSQPSRGRECYAFNRGKCSADHCPFDHVSSLARSQSSWRSNSNSKSVNLVQFEEHCELAGPWICSPFFRGEISVSRGDQWIWLSKHR